MCQCIKYNLIFDQSFLTELWLDYNSKDFENPVRYSTLMANIILINYLVTGVINILAFKIFFGDTDINFIENTLSLHINWLNMSDI